VTGSKREVGVPARPDHRGAVAVLVIVAAYVGLSLRNIACPGLGYDEVMWASVTVRDPAFSWVSYAIGSYPVLLALPYMGTLKGYLYQPILAAVAPSALAIRVPMVVLGAAGLVLVALAARRLVGRAGAIVALALLALHPETVLRIRHDLGAAAPDFFFRAACLWAALRYAEGRRRRDAVAFWVFAFLGVWSKATFVWYVNAYVAAFVFAFGRGWLAATPSRARRVVAVAGHSLALAAVAGWIAFVYLGFDLPRLQASLGSAYPAAWPERLALFGADLARFVAGFDTIAFFQNPFRPPGADLFTAAFAALVTVAAASIVATVVASRGESAQRRTNVNPQSAGIFLLVAALAVLAQLAITAPADKPWHRLSVQPFAALLAAHGACILARAIGRRLEGRAILASRAALAAASAVTLLYYAQIHLHAERTLCEPAHSQRSFSRAAQTTRIHDLLEVVRASDRHFVFLDWGMRNQALLYARDPARVVEYGPGALASAEARARFAAVHLAHSGRDVFVVHGPDATCFPDVRADFFALAAERKVPLRKTLALREGGTEIFELWEVAEARPPTVAPRGAPH
jgi:hypothetical protein